MTEFPAEAFSELTALAFLNLGTNGLSSLPDGAFSGLTALEDLFLNNNDLSSLDVGAFSGLTALSRLNIEENDLGSLPEGLFSDLTALTHLELDDNKLTSLPRGLFSGLTALNVLQLEGNSTNPMELTVTVEKVGTDQARARVLAGAPFAVDIPVTVVDGTLEGSVTVLGVAVGEVNGTEVTVTRTAGTTAAVTVDVDLTTPPTLPVNHRGYIFVKAATGLPETILPGSGTPAAPTNFRTTPGDGQVALAWDAPASGSGVTGHEYRYKTTGTYTSWTAITDSGVGGATEVTVTGLTNAEAYTFELRAVNATGEGAAAAAAVIPMLGICGRTQQIEDAILAAFRAWMTARR